MSTFLEKLDPQLRDDYVLYFEQERNQVFQQCVKEHSVKLHRFISKYIGPYEDANELTQQAFVYAYEAYPTFRGQSAFSTWLYGIAMNLVRNHLSRTPHRRYEFVDDDVLSDLELDSPSPMDNMELSQKVRQLEQAMAELPAHMHEVLMLVALDEMSYEEAATLLKVPVGTVRSRLSRARTLLREKIQPEEMAQDAAVLNS